MKDTVGIDIFERVSRMIVVQGKLGNVVPELRQVNVRLLYFVVYVIVISVQFLKVHHGLRVVFDHHLVFNLLWFR